MKRIRDILNPADYKNYILIRVVSILFATVGAIYVAGGLTVFFDIMLNAGTRTLPFGVGLFIFILGLAAFVGGVALLNGSRRSSTLVITLLSVSILIFPLGIIPIVVMLIGHSRYLAALQRVREETVASRVG